jgi:biopolymer transport protein TolR
MAQIESSARGRNSNVELNLVPFIDLMSVLITFLLISAVWTQVSMIQLGASFASPRSDEEKEKPVPALEDLVLRLDVVNAGYVLTVGTQIKPIPKINQTNYNLETLISELTKIKARYRQKNGIKISIADEIIYDDVVKTMDAGLKAGFAPELLTGGPN